MYFDDLQEDDCSLDEELMGKSSVVVNAHTIYVFCRTGMAWAQLQLIGQGLQLKLDHA